MKRDRDLKVLERRAFRASFDDGLWDILLASVFTMFAVAPLLSGSLGDFWSSAVFLPVWGGVYLGVWIVRRRVLAPRLGLVRLGAKRKLRLRTFAIVMVVVNVVVLALGVVAAVWTSRSGWVWVLSFGFAMLVLLSVVAYFLDMRRLFVYGLLVPISLLAGEWLWQEDLVSHHGFPVMFGATAAVIAICGLVRFVSLLHRHGPMSGGPVIGARG